LVSLYLFTPCGLKTFFSLSDKNHAMVFFLGPCHERRKSFCCPGQDMIPNCRAFSIDAQNKLTLNSFSGISRTSGSNSEEREKRKPRLRTALFDKYHPLKKEANSSKT
jgi:hypothetical protein